MGHFRNQRIQLAARFSQIGNRFTIIMRGGWCILRHQSPCRKEFTWLFIKCGRNSRHLNLWACLNRPPRPWTCCISRLHKFLELNTINHNVRSVVMYCGHNTDCQSSGNWHEQIYKHKFTHACKFIPCIQNIAFSPYVHIHVSCRWTDFLIKF